MAQQEPLPKVHVYSATPSIEYGVGTDIKFVRVLPVDLTSLPPGEDHIAVELLNTMGYAMSVAGWMAHNWELSSELPHKDHQNAGEKITKIFTDIEMLRKAVYNPQFEIMALDIGPWMLQEADETGQLPEKARQVMELLNKINRDVMLGTEVSLEDRKEYQTHVPYIASRGFEQINKKIAEVISSENNRFPVSFFEFQASTDEKPLDTAKTSLDSIGHIQHDAGRMLHRIRFADGGTMKKGLSVHAYLKQSWGSLYRFLAHETQGYAEGITYEVMSPIKIKQIIEDVLQSNQIAGVMGKIDFDNNEIATKPILWARENVANFILNYLYNAGELLGDMEGTRRGADKTFDFVVQIDKVDELPYDAPEGKEDEGEGWLRLVFDDNGPGIREHVAGILGERVFLSGEHGYKHGQDTHGNGLGPQQENIEGRGGVVIARNIVKDGLFGVDYTRDISDSRKVIGARIEVYLPFSAKD